MVMKKCISLFITSPSTAKKKVPLRVNWGKKNFQNFPKSVKIQDAVARNLEIIGQTAGERHNFYVLLNLLAKYMHPKPSAQRGRSLSFENCARNIENEAKELLTLK
jgi:hypothetical protein